MDNQDVQAQLERKKRIARMKTGIVLSIFGWMIVSFIAIVVLVVQVVSIRRDMGRALLASESPNQSTSDMKDYSNIVTGIDMVDNMASEGD